MGINPIVCPTPGNFDRDWTPSVSSLSFDREPEERSSPLHQHASDQLDFLEVEDRGGRRTNDKQPTCIRYLIEWKVMLNNRVVKKDTEQDLVLKPSSYWGQIKENAENTIRRKNKRNQRVRSDDTEVTVSVNDRSQDDLTKTFDNTNVEEKQLLMWGNLLRLPGKRLKLRISINYIEDSDLSLSRNVDKRGSASVTKGMLTERDRRIDAEHASGQPSVWRDVYKTMRCPGPPCRHEGQYCWQDPVGKKHYKLRTHHLKSLVKFVERGGTIETHDDVPGDVRQQLYAEEEQRLEKPKKNPHHPMNGSMCPPVINNINVLPAHSSQHSLTGTDPVSSNTILADFIDISGPLDTAVEEYTAWQKSRVRRVTFKEQIAKAGEVALEDVVGIQGNIDLSRRRRTSVL
ncbi:hypothetical protein SI65_04174 [Aspergillus cristatus]|uniref:Uncharacterized protein n=1 Tax=Aspergillus cristatus TaxID=573508 RepID=A0A1E3BK16_ASPCR|nr:hypothetical protein SI65_04174 [Aspergillus cristatus]